MTSVSDGIAEENTKNIVRPMKTRNSTRLLQFAAFSPVDTLLLATVIVLLSCETTQEQLPNVVDDSSAPQPAKHGLK